MIVLYPVHAARIDALAPITGDYDSGNETISIGPVNNYGFWQDIDFKGEFGKGLQSADKNKHVDRASF